MGIFFSQTKNVNENEEQNKTEEQNVSICEEDINEKMVTQNIVEETVLKKDIDIVVEEIKKEEEVKEIVEEEKVYSKKENWFGRTINKGYTSVREFFEASPDSEF